jgi:methyltransferase FkbM-like protein
MNIHRNLCQNVVALNLGIADAPGMRELVTQSGSSAGFKFQVDTLENIISRLKIQDKINFMKMDIEGFEAEVITKSLATVKEANVISLECHNTKHIIDKVLLQNGFSFKPITMSYIFKKAIKGLFVHRTNYFKAYAFKPQTIYNAIKGFEITKNNELLVGSYIKDR